MTARNGTTAAVFRALAHARRSSRRFQPDRTIKKTILKDILESALRAPSGFNLQPTQVIMVQSADIKKELADHATLGMGNRYRVKDASTVAVICADLQLQSRIDRIERLERDSDTRDPNYLATLPIASSFLTGEGHAATLLKQVATDVLSNVQPMPNIEPVQAWSYKNAALVAQSYVLAATSHGLATCMMEGYDDRRAKQVLRIPDRYGIPFMVATGYEYESELFQPTARLELEEVVFQDVFGNPADFSHDDDDDDCSSDESRAAPKVASG